MLRKTLAALLICGAFVLPTLAQQGPGPGTGVSGIVVNRSTLNSSVVITTGNTFQKVLSSNANTSTPRQALTIQNNNATDSCWITFGVLAGATITAANAAKASSILLTAGQSYTRYWPI